MLIADCIFVLGFEIPETYQRILADNSLEKPGIILMGFATFGMVKLT